MGASVQFIRWEKTSPQKEPQLEASRWSLELDSTMGRGQRAAFGEREEVPSFAHSFIPCILPGYPPCSTGRLGCAAGTTQSRPHSLPLRGSDISLLETGASGSAKGRYNIREGDEGRPGYRPGKGMQAWPAICDGCCGVKEAESNRTGGEALWRVSETSG